MQSLGFDELLAFDGNWCRINRVGRAGSFGQWFSISRSFERRHDPSAAMAIARDHFSAKALSNA
jgi:hypothetical protein